MVLLGSLRVVADVVALGALLVFGLVGGLAASALAAQAQGAASEAAANGAVLTLSILLGLFAGSMTAFLIKETLL